MWKDVFFIVFAVVVGVVMLYANVNEYRQYRKWLHHEIPRRNFQLYNFSTGFVCIYTFFAILSLIFSIVGLINKDLTTLAIGVVTVCLFIGQILLALKRYRMFYDEEGFVLGDKLVSYKSIAKVETISFLPFAYRRLTTYSGETLRVSKGCLEIIDRMKEERRRKKKGRS